MSRKANEQLAGIILKMNFAGLSEKPTYLVNEVHCNSSAETKKNERILKQQVHKTVGNWPTYVALAKQPRP